MTTPRRWLCRVLLVAAGFSAVGVRPASASSIALDFTSGLGLSKVCSSELAPGCTAAWAFTTTTSLSIVGLGIWDEGSNGLVENHQVELWTSSGTLLALAIVTNASSAESSTGPGQWLFTSIAPLALPQGSYVIGAAYSANDSGDPVRFNTIASTIPEVVFGGAWIATGAAGLTAPPDLSRAANLDPGLFGPNFRTAPVPEPASLLLLATGLGALAARRRQRHVTARRKE